MCIVFPCAFKYSDREARYSVSSMTRSLRVLMFPWEGKASSPETWPKHGNTTRLPKLAVSWMSHGFPMHGFPDQVFVGDLGALSSDGKIHQKMRRKSGESWGNHGFYMNFMSLTSKKNIEPSIPSLQSVFSAGFSWRFPPFWRSQPSAIEVSAADFTSMARNWTQLQKIFGATSMILFFWMEKTCCGSQFKTSPTFSLLQK